jgi:hypothetical protein
MLQLPEWARSQLASELIAAILADPPEGRPIRDDWGTRDHRSFAGKIAGRLRRLHKEWVEREYSQLSRKFAIYHKWDHERAREILSAPDGNQLIEQLLSQEQRRAAA